MNEANFTALDEPPSSLTNSDHQNFQSTDYHPLSSCYPEPLRVERVEMPSSEQLRTQLILELIPSLVFALLSAIFQPDVHQRPIPYQIVVDGNDNKLVVLDGIYNNDVAEETVGGWALIGFTAFLPISLFLLRFIIALYQGREKKTIIVADAMAIASVFFYSSGTTILTTNFLKCYIGYLRPNFYKLCGFDMETLDCTASEADVTQGRMSFPSGHSSLSFFSMTLVAYYVLGKLARSKCRKVKMFMTCVFPMGAAAFVAASRVHDNWHHPADVVAGSLIGFACSSFFYHLWYPTLWSPYAGIPLAILAKKTEEDQV